MLENIYDIPYMDSNSALAVVFRYLLAGQLDFYQAVDTVIDGPLF